MLESALAALCGVTTRNLNLAVRRNPQRFPENFMFANLPDQTPAVAAHARRLSLSSKLPFESESSNAAMTARCLFEVPVGDMDQFGHEVTPIPEPRD